MNREELFMPYDGNLDYIFVSYNHKDSEVVYDIITNFHNKGYRIWHDKGIPTGVNFVAELAARVKKCKAFFCFLSRKYIESDYCMRELDFALNNKRNIIPIMLEDFELPDELVFQMNKINRINFFMYKSVEDFSDQLCETAGRFLRSCLGPGQDPPPPPTLWERIVAFLKKHWLPVLLGVAVAALAVVFLPKLLSGGEKPPQPTETVTDVSGTSSPAETPDPADIPPETGAPEPAATAVPTETPEPTAVPTEEPTPKPTAVPIPTISPEDLSASVQKAVRSLSNRAKAGCPLTVYQGNSAGEPADNVYDNAVAALALLADHTRNPDSSDEALRKILDSLTERVNNNTIFDSSIGTGSHAAAAIALMQYDQFKPTSSYLRAARKILDWVLENCRKNSGGFCRGMRDSTRSTADNLWLYSAFRMLAEQVSDKSTYTQAADHAKSYVQSMCPPDGSFFLEGDGADSDAPLSVRTQALAAIVLKDVTGIPAAAELSRSAGLSADDASLEDTLLLILACRTIGLEEEADRALTAASSAYTDTAKTSAVGWYILAAENSNPPAP